MRSKEAFASALLVAGAVLCAMIIGAGCSSRLARENVFANTESAFGLTIAENPQTQMYEMKLGYSRHELFYVPSSKMAFYDKGCNGLEGEKAPCKLSNYNDPSKTPEVLAEIQIGSKAQGKDSGFTLRQRLAIGPKAVESDAAKALLANPNTAEAEAMMAEINTPDHEALIKKLDELLKKDLASPMTIGSQTYKTTDEYAEYLAGKIKKGGTVMEARGWPRPMLKQLVSGLEAAIKP